MKKLQTPLFYLTGLFIILLTACSFSASTANIKEAYSAHEVNGEKSPTTVFEQDEIFYILVDVANAPEDTVTKASWYAVNAEGVEPNHLIEEAEFSGGGKVTFELSNTSLWPVGTYKADIFLDDELNQSLVFTVKGSSSPAPSSGSADSTGTSSGVALLDVYLVRYLGEDFERITTYSPEETFTCDVELTDYSKSTMVKVVWIAVDAEGVAADSFLFEAEGTTSGQAMEFTLNNPNPWPTGQYAVEVYLDGEYQGRADFSVE